MRELRIDKCSVRLKTKIANKINEMSIKFDFIETTLCFLKLLFHSTTVIITLFNVPTNLFNSEHFSLSINSYFFNAHNI